MRGRLWKCSLAAPVMVMVMALFLVGGGLAWSDGDCDLLGWLNCLTLPGIVALGGALLWVMQK